MSARRHHNVFVYYRGPSAKTSERDAHRQLEDNATKAVINVLELGEAHVARSFASRFAPETAHGWPSGKRASFHLQGGPKSIPKGPRILLGISLEAEVDATAIAKASDATGRVDGAIVAPHGALIAIETKVVDLLDPHQLARHRKDWGISDADTHLVRWVEIWEWARTERQSSGEPVSRFLLGQLCEYLEILGFGRWAGFRDEDFAQFTDWSWDHQPVLRARMKGAWERVLDLMTAEDAQWLGEIGAGKLPKGSTHAWAQTNRGQPGTNFTLELGADELQFNLVGWNQAQAQRLEAWLVHDAHRAPDLDLIVHERHALPDHKRDPFWMHATHQIARVFGADEVRSGAFQPWLDEWRSRADPKWMRLAYHLRHTWPRDEVLEREEQLAEEIVKLAADALPLLREINRWKSPPISAS